MKEEKNVKKLWGIGIQNLKNFKEKSVNILRDSENFGENWVKI